jgi:hypothetical protein
MCVSVVSLSVCLCLLCEGMSVVSLCVCVC